MIHAGVARRAKAAVSHSATLACHLTEMERLGLHLACMRFTNSHIASVLSVRSGRRKNGRLTFLVRSNRSRLGRSSHGEVCDEEEMRN